ncbi:MAG TPA: hypothetical protein VK961_21290 [Chthoniobacter sp.]|nr:hypothetical protein [Chthoniobacter sp.]
MILAVFPLACCTLVFAQDVPLVSSPSTPSTNSPPSTKPAKPKSESAILAEQLASEDGAVQQQALDKVKEVLAKPPVMDDDGKPRPQMQVDVLWVRSLIKVRRYEDAESLALAGILRKPDGMWVAAFQKARSQALLAAGKHDAALSAAKAYYNVCQMKDTAAAIDQIGLCLINARPTEKGLATKFKTQQVNAATTQPSGQPAAPIEDNVLKSVTIDPKPYEQAIQAITISQFGDLVGKGNLLLLADRAKEAKDAFETAMELAQKPKDTATAIEGVARAIRAETGSIGAANAYIISQQGSDGGK